MLPRTLSPILVCAAALAPVSTTQAQDSRSNPIAVPGTDATLRLVSNDRGEHRGEVSRDGGHTWARLHNVDHRVRVGGLEFDPAAGGPALPPYLLAPPDGRLFLVQFETDIISEYATALARMGAEIAYYIPNQTYLVRMSRALVAEVTQQPFVRAVADYHVGYRLSPDIIAELVAADMSTQRYNILVVQRTDAPLLERAIEMIGGEVNISAGGGILVEATLTTEQLLRVASLDAVLWVDAWSSPEPDVELARVLSGATYVETVAGIDGKGVRGHVFEGVQANHPEFAARPPYRQAPIPLGPVSMAAHGTNVGGVLFAQGLSVKGFLPFGQMIYTDHIPVLTGTVSRFSITQQLVDPSQIYQGMFQVAAWGASRTTGYTSVSAALDDTLFQLDVFTTNSQSNAGATPSRPEAWAKNCVGIGGFLHHNNLNPADDCWCFTGSTGPAADGRVGLSFVAPYDAAQTTAMPSGYVSAFGGTSVSTPIATGVAGLAMQVFTDGLLGYPAVPWQSRFDATPHLTTTRVLLSTTSRQIRYSQARRTAQGWGFPHIGDLYDNRDNILVLDEEDVLQQGQRRTYYVWVKPGTPELRASMHHLEPPALPASMPNRTNSLDLQVVAPDGTVYWGNDAGLLSGPYSSGGGSPNDIDIHENVFLANPAPGIYEVTVRATGVRMDAHLETPELDVDFALAVRGIGSGRDRSGMVLDLVSDQAGQLDVALTNLPSGWLTGSTLLSVTTQRHVSLGNLFGLEADALTFGTLGAPPVAGGLFAFVTTANPALYPNAAFRFPAAIAAVLQGVTFDGVAFVRDVSGQITVSNVDRVTVQ